MPKMQFVTEEMMDRARKILESAGRIHESQNAVLNIFSNMGRDFSGKVPSLMTQQMLAMESDYQNMNNMLTSYSEFLDKAADNYEWSDAELAKWASALGRTE